MYYKLFISDDVLSYGNSLLYPSGIEIASISCVGESGKTYWVSLQTQGSVCILYKDNVYKHISQFPDELVDLIKSVEFSQLVNSGEIEIRENNWWEFVFSDGDGDLLDCDPKDYKSKSELAQDLFNELDKLMTMQE